MNWFKRLFGGGKKPPDDDVSHVESSNVAPLPQPAATAESMPTYPFPLVAVRGAEVERTWRRLQAEWRKEGASAVLVGDAEEIAEAAEMMKFNEETPQAYLQRAAAMSAQSFFAERRAELAENGATAEEGEWPGGAEGPDLGAHLDVISRQPKPQVFIARVPTVNSWEIPAWLKFGGWNACPSAEQHVSVMQYWAKEYDLQIYAITGDVIECTVARPPASQGAAMALAREQYLYCNDIVDQGTQTISALGAALQDNAVWYFWWD